MKNKDIAALINLHFNPPPAEKAAQALFSLGVHSDDIQIRALCHMPPFLGEPQVLAVINALRDLERNVSKLNIEILTKRIAKNKQDSIFYAGKNIARVSVGVRTYVLTTSGTYDFCLKENGPAYKFDSCCEEIRGRVKTVISKLTDARIKALGDNDLVSNAGWFGINVYEADHYLDSSDEVWSEYDEALKAFKTFVTNNIAKGR